MTETNGKWLAVYYRYGSLESRLFNTEQEGLEFLRDGTDFTELVIIGLHGPDKDWTADEIEDHFQEIWEREHAEEIAADEERREQQQREYDAWLAEQPAWKRDLVSSVALYREDGHDRVTLNGLVLPFRTLDCQIEYTSDAGTKLTLTIPLEPSATLSREFA